MILNLTCSNCYAEFKQEVIVRICPVSEWEQVPGNDPPPPDSECGHWTSKKDGLTHIEAINQERLDWHLKNTIYKNPLCPPCLQEAQIEGQRKLEQKAKWIIANSNEPREVEFYKKLMAKRAAK